MSYATARDLIHDISENNHTTNSKEILFYLRDYFKTGLAQDTRKEEVKRLGLSTTANITDEIDFYLRSRAKKNQVSAKSIRRISEIINKLDKDLAEGEILTAVCQKLEDRYNSSPHLESSLKRIGMSTLFSTIFYRILLLKFTGC